MVVHAAEPTADTTMTSAAAGHRGVEVRGFEPLASSVLVLGGSPPCRPPARRPCPCAPTKGSAAALVEVLEQVVGGQLDLLVAPFGGPVLAGDQAHAVQAAEVAVDEGVPSLGVVGGAVGEGQMPVGVLLPGVGLQEGVLVLGARLDVAPLAPEHVLAGVDELAGPRHCLLVDRVGSHGRILAMRAPGGAVEHVRAIDSGTLTCGPWCPWQNSNLHLLVRR